MKKTEIQHNLLITTSMITNKVYWTDAKGNKIDVDSMSIDYLRNVLKYILRQRELDKAEKFFNTRPIMSRRDLIDDWGDKD